MHILLAFLGAVVTLLVLLHRLADIGVDLGGLNPFAWRRRKAWRQKFDANPIFTLSDPREIASVLIVAVAKIDGDLSAEEKRAVLAELEQTLSLAPEKAAELLRSAVFLLGDLAILDSQRDALLDRYAPQLDASQRESLLAILGRIAGLDGGPSGQQQALISAIEAQLQPGRERHGAWD